jgi:hypothetical protein
MHPRPGLKRIHIQVPDKNRSIVAGALFGLRNGSRHSYALECLTVIASVEFTRKMDSSHNDVGVAAKAHFPNCESLTVLQRAEEVRRKPSKDPNSLVGDRSGAGRVMEGHPYHLVETVDDVTGINVALQ